MREHQKQFPVVMLCRVMRVASSGYFAWLHRPESPRAKANRALAARIKAAHARSHKTYGRRRICIQLQRDGVVCSPNRVARLMRQEGICGLRRRAYKPTTDSHHSFPVAPNLLARDFTATAPNQIWVSDITYLPTQEGWEYLATVMDLYNRRVVGWAMQSTLKRSLTLRALAMAVAQRRPGSRADPPLRSGQPVCLRGLPESPATAGNAAQHVSQRRLLGQRARRKPLWHAQVRAGASLGPAVP